MSNNSYPCRGGGEIGRAQVAQAEACGLEPEPAMNPILLKPNGDGTSQVVVNGRVWKTLSARDYYAHVDELRGEVLAAYDDLAQPLRRDRHRRRRQRQRAEPARARSGQPRARRRALGAPWLLVADIERGGVFASVIGTVQLLTPDERALFRGFAINKFRGDLSLFDEGVQHPRGADRRRRASACFPTPPTSQLDAEDSLALDHAPARTARRRARGSPSSASRSCRTRPTSGC